MFTKSSPRREIALLIACAAQFMVVLDIAIVNVALPSIQRDLGEAIDVRFSDTRHADRNHRGTAHLGAGVRRAPIQT